MIEEFFARVKQVRLLYVFQYKGARNYQHNYSTQTLSSNSSHVAEISHQVMKHNKLKNRPQMVLKFTKEIVVCLRVALRKSEESSH